MFKPWTPSAAMPSLAPRQSQPSVAETTVGFVPKPCGEPEACNWLLSSLDLRLGLRVRELASEAAEALWTEHFLAL